MLKNVACALFFSAFVSGAKLKYTGVNLAGPEFDDAAHWPTDAEAAYWKSKGATLIRIPIKWERIQLSLGATLDSAYLTNLKSIVTSVTSRNMYAIIDVHNYARYNSNIIGQTTAYAKEYLQDLWKKIGTEFASNQYVIAGIMNEPNGMTTELWFQDAQAAINGVRQSGFTGYLLIPGNAWQGVHSWTETWYGTANSVAFNVSDPLNKYFVDVHEYFDSDYSGQSETCTSSWSTSSIFSGVTSWARTKGLKVFLTEFGAGANTACQTIVEDVLTYLETNSDVYAGWTWWAAGPAWGTYKYTVEPSGSAGSYTDQTQTAWIVKHFPNSTTTPATASSHNAVAHSSSKQVVKHSSSKQVVVHSSSKKVAHHSSSKKVVPTHSSSKHAVVTHSSSKRVVVASSKKIIHHSSSKHVAKQSSKHTVVTHSSSKKVVAASSKHITPTPHSSSKHVAKQSSKHTVVASSKHVAVQSSKHVTPTHSSVQHTDSATTVYSVASVVLLGFSALVALLL